jgi:predicted nucleotidyltransferase
VKNSFGIYEKSYSLLLDAFASFPEIEKVTIYGSRAMGNYKKGSDIDLAITGKEITGQTITKLSARLNEEMTIPYFIDVLDYKTLENQKLKNHIDQEGIVFYNK